MRLLPGARTRTCSHCRGSVDWRRDGVPFLDGTCAHLACHERAEQRPEAPSATPSARVDALAWARERAADLLRATGRTDVSTLAAELRDAGFGKAGRAWREGAG